MKTIKHSIKEWEISIIKIGDKYKVARRLPNLSVAETQIFNSKEEAVAQFNEWLQ
tara:strand:+ start:300 stop:464 length:165 start_codon:yes stop_codon:yes gene_type:complete